jgi:acyl carrier protein
MNKKRKIKNKKEAFMEREVIDIIAKEQFVSPENVQLSTRLEQDLDMDEEDRLMLQIKLEDGLHISISQSDMSHFETVNDIVEYAAKKKPYKLYLH